jgi:hypothetical protein
MVGAPRIALAVVLYSALLGVAHSDEQMLPIAISGDWAAFAHHTSMIASADVCMVFNIRSGFALRADKDGMQLRIGNAKWSLPAGVEGNVTVNVGVWKTTLNIGGNTDVVVSAEVPYDIIAPMFAAMDNASTMSIEVGKAKPFLVSLSGSTMATNAFRTCAGIRGNARTPGANPFQ